MLENSFIHVPGIAQAAERLLWEQGCFSWSHYKVPGAKYSCGSADSDTVKRVVDGSIKALASGRHQYFRKGLGLAEAWRAFPDFRSKCVYLDIETDGGQRGDSVTTIGLYDGQDFKCLIKGIDLGNFPDVISHYSMIVTFFGAGFDLPMLQKCFPLLRLDQIHLDLCPTLRRIGLRGGLKSIERQMGIARGDDTDGLGGQDAIRLWRRYKTLQDEAALAQLVAYNREDVVNLERLACHAYDTLKRELFGSFDAR